MISKIQIIKSQRRTIGISIHPDLTIKIRAPKSISTDKINEIIKLKEKWILKKIQYFKTKQLREKYIKKYISGEIFYYLGKKYLLHIFKSDENYVKITDDEIFLHIKNEVNAKKILINWFQSQAVKIFSERLLLNYQIFSKVYSYDLPELKIRKMKARWGSLKTIRNSWKILKKSTIMTLNTNLIHTDIKAIDYVIMHELCHLKHNNHGKDFYKLQSYFTPEYKMIKKSLQEYDEELGSL